QPAGGRSLDAVGVSTPSVDGFGSPAGYAANMGAFIWGYLNRQGSVHSMPEYIRRLGLLQASLPGQDGGETAGGSWGEPDNIDIVEANRIERNNERNIFAREVGRAEADIVIPREAQFSTSHKGLVWSVKFGGSTVAVG